MREILTSWKSYARKVISGDISKDVFDENNVVLLDTFKDVVFSYFLLKTNGFEFDNGICKLSVDIKNGVPGVLRFPISRV